jgi:hypothetical protein
MQSMEDPPAPRLPRGLVVAVLATLMIAHVVPYAWATVMDDTARDFFHARQILEHGDLPWRGPVINQMAHLGPAWFYLYAAFLGLAGNLAGTLGLVGLLAALKFPLAYACGTRWRGPMHGLAWAVLLAMPGWPLLQQVWVTHWNLVELLSLASLYPLIRLAQGAHARHWLAYGLLQGAALHAHPSTLVLVLIVPIVIRCRGLARIRDDIPALAAGVLLSLLGFVPMLLAEYREGWPAVGRIAAFAAQHAATPWHATLPSYIEGALLGGTRFVLGDLVPHAWRLPVVLLHLVVLLASGAGLVLAWRVRTARRGLLAALAGLALALVAIRFMRPVTPFYMLLPWWVLATAVLAQALQALDRSGATGRQFARGALAASLVLSILASAMLVRRAEQGSMSLPVHAVGDVARADASRPVLLLPAWRHDALGERLCGSQRPVVLHGDLAVAIHVGMSLGSRLRCGERGEPWIGGGAAIDAAEHWLGLSPHSRMRAELAPMDWDAIFAPAPLRVVAAAASQRAPDRLDNAFRLGGTGDLRRHRLRFTAARDEVLVVSQVYALFDGSHIHAVRADGRDARERHASGGVSVYECDMCREARVEWEVEIDSGFPDRFDLVLAPRPGG